MLTLLTALVLTAADSVVVTRVPDFESASATFVDVPGSTLALTGGRTVIFFQGDLRSASTTGSIEFEWYDVASGNPLVRAGAIGTPRGSARSWFFFDSGVPMARTVRARIRHTLGVSSSSTHLEVAVLELSQGLIASRSNDMPTELSGPTMVVHTGVGSSNTNEVLYLTGLQLRTPPTAVLAYAESRDPLFVRAPAPNPGPDQRSFVHVTDTWDSMVGAGQIQAPSFHTTTIVAGANVNPSGTSTSTEPILYASARIVELPTTTLQVESAGSAALLGVIADQRAPVISLNTNRAPGSDVFLLYGGYSESAGGHTELRLRIGNTVLRESINEVRSGERQVLAGFSTFHLGAAPDFSPVVEGFGGPGGEDVWNPYLLLLGPLDGGVREVIVGVAVDAGLEIDAGIDAGTDAGTPDAGEPDAGLISIDAGLISDAGSEPPPPDPRLRQLVVGCGCSTSDPFLLIILLLPLAKGRGSGRGKV